MKNLLLLLAIFVMTSVSAAAEQIHESISILGVTESVDNISTEGWAWNKETKVLTIKDLKLSVNPSKFAILLNVSVPATIKVVGENVIVGRVEANNDLTLDFEPGASLSVTVDGSEYNSIETNDHNLNLPTGLVCENASISSSLVDHNGGSDEPQILRMPGGSTAIQTPTLERNAAVKKFMNGQIVIVKDNKIYNLSGVEVK